MTPDGFGAFDAAGFRAAVLAWYDARGRTLPFRGTTDPYAILVSETMAQQTQIGRVGPAWVSFMARFPTLESLAAAPPADVQREWRGLGYNRRALNLQRTARIVVEEHGGRLPTDLATLERLPGIGPYTARAVAAIAFGAPVGAVDTNVRRVLGRVLGGDRYAFPPRRLQAIADALVAPGRAPDWTHAVMDVGATFCRSTNPTCGACPARRWCRYAAGASGDGPRGGQTRVGAGRAAPGTPAVPYERTSRWLRGRILDRARGADGDAWVSFSESVGSHPPERVAAALAVLEGEGLLERAAHDPTLARLARELPPARPVVPAGGGRR